MFNLLGESAANSSLITENKVKKSQLNWFHYQLIVARSVDPPFSPFFSPEGVISALEIAYRG